MISVDRNSSGFITQASTQPQVSWLKRMTNNVTSVAVKALDNSLGTRLGKSVINAANWWTQADELKTKLEIYLIAARMDDNLRVIYHQICKQAVTLCVSTIEKLPNTDGQGIKDSAIVNLLGKRDLIESAIKMQVAHVIMALLQSSPKDVADQPALFRIASAIGNMIPPIDIDDDGAPVNISFWVEDGASEIIKQIFPKGIDANLAATIPGFTRNIPGIGSPAELLKSKVIDLPQLIKKTLKSILEKQIAPILILRQTRAINLDKLNKESGSVSFGLWSQALAKDAVTQFSNYLGGYQSLAKELYETLSGIGEPNPADVHKFASELKKLSDSGAKVTNLTILNAYYSASGNTFADKKYSLELLEKIEVCRAVKKLAGIYIATPNLINLGLDGTLAKLASPVSNELAHIDIFSNSYQTKIRPLQECVESILLSVFRRIAHKNPPETKDENGQKVVVKDSAVVLVENLFGIAQAEYQAAHARAVDGKINVDELMRNVNKQLMQNLGLSSAKDLVEVPEPHREKVFAILETALGDLLQPVKISMLRTKKHTKRRRLKKKNHRKDQLGKIADSYAEVLAQQIVRSVGNFTPTLINSNAEKGANMLGGMVTSSLASMVSSNFSIGGALMHMTEAQSRQFPQILQSNLAALHDTSIATVEKEFATDFIRTAVLSPIDTLLHKTLKLEAKYAERLDQKLAQISLKGVAEHLKSRNIMRKKLKQSKSQPGNKITHAALVEAARESGTLHTATPKTSVNSMEFRAVGIILTLINKQEDIELKAKLQEQFSKLADAAKQQGLKLTTEKIIDMIKNDDSLTPHVKDIQLLQNWHNKEGLDLADLIRHDAIAYFTAEVDQVYRPLTMSILNMVLPNGSADLTFLPPERRELTYALMKTILPGQLSSAIDSFVLQPYLSPRFVKELTLNIMKNVQFNMEQPIPPPTSVPTPTKADTTDGALDLVSGELLEQLLVMLDIDGLPAVVKNYLLDKDGNIKPEMKQMLGQQLGETMRGQFAGKFLKDMVVKLEDVGKRVEVTVVPLTDEELEQQLATVSRQTLNAVMGYTIRRQWANFQIKLDANIERIFGKFLGTNVKNALDTACRFVFFNMIGSVLSYLFKNLIANHVYHITRLDANLKAMLDVLIERPENQKEQFNIFHKNMLFRILDDLKISLEELHESNFDLKEFASYSL